MDAYQTGQDTDGERDGVGGSLSFLISSEKVGFVLAALLLLGTLPFWSALLSFSVAVGAAVSLGNFRVLIILASKLENANVSRQTLWISIFLMKFSLLLLAIFLILRYMHLSPLGFLIGISVTPLAIIFGSQLLMLRERS